MLSAARYFWMGRTCQVLPPSVVIQIACSFGSPPSATPCVGLVMPTYVKPNVVPDGSDREDARHCVAPGESR